MNKRTFLSAAGFSLLALASSNAQTTVYQVANDTSSSAWSTKSAPWGQTPIAANNYVTAPDLPGATTETASGFGANFTTRLRDTGSIFPGNSLTVVGDTEVLLKGGNNSVSTANIILSGGIIAYGVTGPNTVGLAGNLNVQTTGILGMGGNNTLNVSSTLTGSGTLMLSASDTSPTINFTGNDSGFNGVFQIGDGGAAGFVTVDFTQSLNPSASITMGTVGTSADVLDLSSSLIVSSFDFGATSLAAGTYTAAELNSLVGNSSQFTGSGTLTIQPVPEPSVVLLGSFGTLLLLFKRGAIRRRV